VQCTPHTVCAGSFDAAFGLLFRYFYYVVISVRSSKASLGTVRSSRVLLHVCFSEEVIDVHAGDQHIMRYKPIAGLVSSGDAVLI